MLYTVCYTFILNSIWSTVLYTNVLTYAVMATVRACVWGLQTFHGVGSVISNVKLSLHVIN
jgi:hypothetical protein